MALKPTRDERRIATLAKALGHPARVRILATLAATGACQTGSLVDRLPLAQSTISEHLRILREARLIKGEIDGPRTCYCVDAAVLQELRAALDRI